MAKNEIIDRVFSQLELDTLESHKKAIMELGTQAEGIAISLAYHLWDISAKKLYEIESKEDGTAFKGIGDYAEYTFGISKGTTSDSVNTFERFGNRETQQIADKWKEYRFSNLMAIKKLSDEEIAIAGITSADSKATIKAKLDHYKIEQGKVAMLPDKRKEAVELWNKVVNAFKADEITEQQRDELTAELEERFNSKEPKISELSYDDVQLFKNIVTRHMDNWNKEQSIEDKSESVIDEYNNSTVETNTDEHTVTVPAKNSIVVTPQCMSKILKLINKDMGYNINCVADTGDFYVIQSL